MIVKQSVECGDPALLWFFFPISRGDHSPVAGGLSACSVFIMDKM